MKQFVLIVLALCLVAVLAVAACNMWMIHSATPAIHTLEEAEELSGDCILVLGCGLRRDGYPSQMLCDRLDVAIEAYRMGLAPKLLMSGDHGQDHYDEVNAMKDYAMAKGIPSEDIFMDHAGFSTYESMYRAKAIFHCDRVIVVTQRYHLYRAIADARAMGMEAAGISSDARSYARQWYFDIREVAARAKDTLYCLVKPRPTYLGQSIPIFGNGDATNDR
ncbi:MAG: SanA protein [Clostridiales bacterium]|nr:SanA protein [Clostridiales bacterium]